MKSLGSIRRSFAPWNDPSAKPYISFENVTKVFGDFTAVDDLSLDIYEKEFFALLGGSGSGKSTLLRMLAGFDEPTKGRILLDGQDLRGIPPYRRPLNMMFQSYALFPHMTVEANVAFGLKQEGMPKADIGARVKEMLKLVKLEQFSKRKPHQLSGGQRQRVALARSVAKRPKVLLLDEPLGALDKKLREETQFELMDLQQSLGLTFVIVTHDQEEAMTMADRIAILDKGQIMQVATPAEIYEAPTSRFVANFVGNVNMFEGTVAAREANTARITRRQRSGDHRRERRRRGCRQRRRLRRPPGEDQGLVAPAGRHGQRHGGRNLRSRLSRRHDYLSRTASGRSGGEGQRAEQLAPHRRPADLERPRLDILPAGCRRRADAVGAADEQRRRRHSRLRSIRRRRALSAFTRRAGGDGTARHHRPLSLAALLLPRSFIIVFKISLSTTAIAMPPYTPVFSLEEGLSGLWSQLGELNIDNYLWLTDDPLYFNAYVSSVWIAGVSTLLALLVGYPIAYGMARAPASLRPTLLMLVILPFWTSFLIRVYAWIGILKPEDCSTSFSWG
jgi:putrescine transport system ATP-binding protein